MERMSMVVGEERSIHLPPIAEGDWTHHVDGMASAVDVRKLWAARPYPEDDEEEDDDRQVAQDVVFMVRAVSPGEASLRFVPTSSSSEQPRIVQVSVRT